MDNRRFGLGLVIGMTPAQDEKFDACMREARRLISSYSVFGPNCTTDAQVCLIRFGIPLSPSLTPYQIQDSLFDQRLVRSVNRCDP